MPNVIINSILNKPYFFIAIICFITEYYFINWCLTYLNFVILYYCGHFKNSIKILGV